MRLASGESGPAKRRISSDRPAPHAALPPKTMAALSLGKQSSGSLTSDSNGIGRKRARSPSASGRPQRKVPILKSLRREGSETSRDLLLGLLRIFRLKLGDKQARISLTCPCIVKTLSCPEQAAVKSASRTAEFATTGDWPEEEEAMYPTSPIERSMSPSASVRSRRKAQ